MDPSTSGGVPGRGTLYPALLPDFHRLAPEPAAQDLVRWFWVVRWHLADGEVSTQRLIGFPALNLVVEDGLVGLSGATTRAAARQLAGAGWAVGALLRPAAVPALTSDPAALRDRYQRLDEPGLHAAVTEAMPDGTDGRAAAAVISTWLAERVGEITEEARLANRLVELAEDAGVQRVSELASLLAVSERTLQRLARSYIGLGPAVLIRRRRLQEAAQRLREEPDADLAALAAQLGYVDQAHLTNDFARVLGFTPGRYRRTVTG